MVARCRCAPCACLRRGAAPALARCAPCASVGGQHQVFRQYALAGGRVVQREPEPLLHALYAVKQGGAVEEQLLAGDALYVYLLGSSTEGAHRRCRAARRSGRRAGRCRCGRCAPPGGCSPLRLRPRRRRSSRRSGGRKGRKASPRSARQARGAGPWPFQQPSSPAGRRRRNPAGWKTPPRRPRCTGARSRTPARGEPGSRARSRSRRAPARTGRARPRSSGGRPPWHVGRGRRGTGFRSRLPRSRAPAGRSSPRWEAPARRRAVPVRPCPPGGADQVFEQVGGLVGKQEPLVVFLLRAVLHVVYQKLELVHEARGDGAVVALHDDVQKIAPAHAEHVVEGGVGGEVGRAAFYAGLRFPAFHDVVFPEVLYGLGRVEPQSHQLLRHGVVYGDVLGVCQTIRISIVRHGDEVSEHAFADVEQALVVSALQKRLFHAARPVLHGKEQPLQVREHRMQGKGRAAKDDPLPKRPRKLERLVRAVHAQPPCAGPRRHERGHVGGASAEKHLAFQVLRCGRLPSSPSPSRARWRNRWLRHAGMKTTLHPAAASRSSIMLTVTMGASFFPLRAGLRCCPNLIS